MQQFIPGFRGRFRRHYHKFEKNEVPVQVLPIRDLKADSDLFDIVNEQLGNTEFGTVRIFCWLKPEHETKGRRWGKHGLKDAVIMPFRTLTWLGNDSIKLKEYQLELFLCCNRPEGSSPPSPFFDDSCPVGQYDEPCSIHSEICLANLPAPGSMAGCPADSPLDAAVPQTWWKLKSAPGCSCANSSRAARWTWEANGHDPITLHGGLALQHLGNPFLIAARVRGQAFIQDSKFRRGQILKFGSDIKPIQWWRVAPKSSNEDLSSSIATLDAEIVELNTASATKLSPDHGARMDNTQCHNFDTPTIKGHATVFQGNISIGNNFGGRFHTAGGQQYNPTVTTLELPQAMES